MLDVDACDDQSYRLWAAHLADALQGEFWKNMDINQNNYSWEKRIEGYLSSLNL